MASHTSILGWKIPWTEEPGGLQPTGLQRATSAHMCVGTHTHTEEDGHTHTVEDTHTHTHTHTHTLEDHLLPVCPGLPWFQPWKLQVQCPENPPESQANQDGSRIYHQEPAMVTKTSQQVPRLSISVTLLENKKERRDLSPYLSHENGVSSSTVRSCG